jgi:phospholipid transport system substrate-binding protein
MTENVFRFTKRLLILLPAALPLTLVLFLKTDFAFAQDGSVEVPLSAFATVVSQPYGNSLPQPLIEEMVDELLDKLSANAERIDQDASVAYELSNELVVPYLDFPRMSRIIIGKYWRDANNEQRQRLIDEISALLIRSYVTAMSAYSDDTLTDEQIVYMPSRFKAGDRKATVRAKVTLDSGQSIDVRYALLLTDGQWKIYDISFEGVSLALTYRGSFGSIIKQNGLDALIVQLENRNKTGEIDLPGAVTRKMYDSTTKDNKNQNQGGSTL